jgi:hypothetical protein
MMKLRRPFVSDRYFFITVRLLPRRTKTRAFAFRVTGADRKIGGPRHLPLSASFAPFKATVEELTGPLGLPPLADRDSFPQFPSAQNGFCLIASGGLSAHVMLEMSNKKHSVPRRGPAPSELDRLEREITSTDVEIGERNVVEGNRGDPDVRRNFQGPDPVSQRGI